MPIMIVDLILLDVNVIIQFPYWKFFNYVLSHIEKKN